MTDTNATPADGAATEANDQPVNLDEVKAPDAEPAKADDSREPAEGGEPPDDTQDDDRPRRRSRTDRLKDRIRDLEAELTVARGRNGSEERKAKAPQESDFGTDFAAYERAQRAYEVEEAVRRVRDEDTRAATHARELEIRRHQGEIFNERLSEASKSVPDLKQTLEAARGMEIRDEVADFIRESEVGPMLAYHLAKNPTQTREINAMNPVAAMRELARIETRLSPPNPKKQTSAPAPIAPVNSGASSSPDLSKMSMEEYAAHRRKQSGR